MLDYVDGLVGILFLSLITDDMIYSDEIKFCADFLKKKGLTPEQVEEVMALATDVNADFELIRVQTNDFVGLAEKMRELWPAGEKEGKWPWRDSVDNIAKRLEFIWRDRFPGKQMDIEECLSVARKYLARFQDNTKYMKVLKYFIFKRKDDMVDKKTGRIRYNYESLFADMLEGKKFQDELQSEWEDIINDANAGEGNLV